MTAAPRPIAAFYSLQVVPTGVAAHLFNEVASEKLAWLQLRQLTDDPHAGLALFTGTRAQRNVLCREFQNYVRQAKTYWDAASRTDGSAAALPYYYSLLNLAKAELLQTNASAIVGEFIRHGLTMRASTSPSIRGDRLLSQRGVFSLLYKKRVGTELPFNTTLRVPNMLSIIPEIGLEVGHFGRSRPYSPIAYHTIAADQTSAWSMLMFSSVPAPDPSEPVIKALLRSYEPISMSDLRNWRDLFALSSRMIGNDLYMFQSKRTFEALGPQGEVMPDYLSAQQEPFEVLGLAAAPPTAQQGELVITHTLTKSRPTPMPLQLVRYATMFYLSSLVRYKPSSLDPTRQGKQAWLMDSLVTETPLSLLIDAIDGITGKRSLFEPAQYRN